ncbi:CCT domain-containing protein [Dioscorea alata]|uniref:CCT domain-containing protein n=1 Tax=Dioscorea alata TaxID=55571 RepID=A0ACB7WDJ7_DIOAL|nr:CCT domain-containing protein [Dioscorea alata]
MSLISDVDDVITTETIQIADVESIQIEHLDDIINECKKVFLAKSLTEETIPEHEVAHQIDEEDSEKAKSRIIAEGQMQKSVSSGSLESMEWINACCNRRPNFLNYQGLDFEAALGMRRPISEEALQPEFLQGSIVQSSAVLEYDLGGEGDLFKAPEPIIGESVLALDPIASGMSLISDVDDVITAETIQIADVESIQIEHLDDIINECKKVFLAKSLTEETIPEHEVAQQIDEEDSEKAKSRIIAEGQMQKSVSSGSLESMEWINACCNRRPNFLNYQGLDFEAALGMRRPIREEALQTPVSDNYTSDNCTGILHAYKKSEERREKLSRYRRKKSLRNFNRKIVYAGRKAFADNQLRVRGRFAKTGDRCIYPDHRKKSLKR